MMLKKLVTFTILALICWLPSFAADEIQIEIDGEPLVLDVVPQIENGRTLVPFKAILEALGLKIDWIGEQRIATAYNSEMNVSVKIDGAYGNINGELFRLDVPAKVVDERTLVPLKFISEAFGNEVSWNAEKRLISIKSGFKPYVYTEILPTVDSIEKLKLILEYAGKYTNYISPVYDDFIMAPILEDKENAADDLNAESAPAAEPEHSETNVQVEGVDEADVIKTDGNLIYQLRAQDLKITDISTGEMKNIATIKFEDFTHASELYLYDSKLIVIGSSQMYYPMFEDFGLDIMPMPQYAPQTYIYFYDVSEPENPVLIRKYVGDGTYMTSRLTGGKLYMVWNKWLNSYNLTAENILPKFTDQLFFSGSDVVKASTIDFDTLRYFPDTVESNMMITLGFNLDHITYAPHLAAYLGNSTNIYANLDTMIIAMDRYHYDVRAMGESFAPSFRNTTELYKFNLVDGTINFSAKGSVPGRVSNQFSMDAYKGDYRIATTSGETWSNTSQNNVYVLGSDMKIKGKLEGLAPGERIYSARFAEDRAYLVTFKQVDPFFVIDLKEPSKPEVLGYLKIPGFSDYLHPYDANTVIGFGRETIDTANGPILGGIKIAMFDVTDVTKPVEKSKIVLGSSNSWSEVLNNHKALLISKDKNLFALPVTLYNRVDNDIKFTFQGAYVYSISPTSGFVLRGTSTHLTQPEIEDSMLKWYDTSKNVSRVIWSGTSLYTLSNYGIKKHNLDDMMELEFLIY